MTIFETCKRDVGRAQLQPYVDDVAGALFGLDAGRVQLQSEDMDDWPQYMAEAVTAHADPHLYPTGYFWCGRKAHRIVLTPPSWTVDWREHLPAQIAHEMGHILTNGDRGWGPEIVADMQAVRVLCYWGGRGCEFIEYLRAVSRVWPRLLRGSDSHPPGHLRETVMVEWIRNARGKRDELSY